MPPSSSSPLRIAVAGAGFSGLAAAIRLADLAAATGRSLELTVFEGSARIGGLVATRPIGDYLVELGADAFITNKPGGVEICRRLGLESRLISTDPRFRQSFVLHRGQPVPTPAGFQLIAPTRLRPFLNSPLLSWRGKKRVLAEPTVPPRRDTADESIASFARRRFGDEAYSRIIQPMVGGIYTGDLERLSLSATFPRFLELERRHGSVLRALRKQRTADASGARYGLFVSLPGGMGELLDAMAAEVRKSHLIAGSSKVAGLIRAPNGRWRFDAAGKPHEVDALVLAIPAHHAASVIGGQQPDLAAELQAIEYSSSAIVVSGHRLDGIRHPLNGAGLVIPHIEGRRILAVSFASRKFPGRAPEGRVILRTFLGGALQGNQLQDDDFTLKAIVREELQSILGVTGQPDFCEVARYPRGIPQYVIGHQQRVARIESIIGRLPGLALAGNAYHGVGIPDAITSGVRAAEQVWSSLGGNPGQSFASHLPPRQHSADSGHHSAAGLSQ